MNKRLLSLLSLAHPVSGEALAEHFQCSRAAISKQIDALKSAGVLVRGRPRVGYQLEYEYHWWQARSVAELLDPLPLSVSVLDTVLSTNTWLRERAPAETCQLAITDWQQAGRGRRGRQWLSPPGRQLTLSLRTDSSAGPWPWQGLALAVGVELAETLISFGIPAQLKWPNDIWLAGAKLGGILVELDAASDGPSTIIVGLGLNEYLTEGERQSIDRPVSDLSSYVNQYTRDQLLYRLMERLINLLATYPSAGIGAWLSRWEHLDVLREQCVSFEHKGALTQGVAQGLDEQGCLRVLTAQGLVACQASEVSLSTVGVKA